jgi:hypothetical protein
MEGCILISDPDEAAIGSGSDGIDCSVMERDFCINKRNVKVRLPVSTTTTTTDKGVLQLLLLRTRETADSDDDE